MKPPVVHTLSASFMIFRFLGLWAPYHFNSLWKNSLYKFYTCIVIFIGSLYVATGTISLIQTCRTVFNFSNDGFRLLASVIAFGKVLNVLICRGTIIGILKTLETYPCLPRNTDEIFIQNEYSRKYRNITIQFCMIMNLMVYLMISHTIQHDIPARKLPRKAWLPYDYSHDVKYWFSCSLQVITLLYLYATTVGYDTLVCGMFLEISGKLNILKYRFINLHETFEKELIDGDWKSEDILKIERNLMTDCVTYHLCLFDLAKRINSTFSVTIFLQYVISTGMLCLTVYTISGMKLNSPGFIFIMICLVVILTEIFLLCACANEVTIESDSIAQSVFAMDWMNFTQTTCKSAIIIGCQSCRPIIFTTGYFVTLSLDSFKSLVKVAYSVYSALQSLN